MGGQDQDIEILHQENTQLRERIRQLESNLRVAEHFRGTLDGMLEGFQLIGFDWRYLYVNDAAARQGRRSREDLLGRTMMEAYPGIDETPMFAALRVCMEDRRPQRMENEFRFPDGGTGCFELSIEPSPSGIVILSLDVTRRRNLEAQLRQAQKMEAVGRLAAGVAHDFNNLLTVIKAYGGFAREVAGDSAVGDDLAEVLAAADRAAELTRRLLAFSRQQPVVPRVIELTELVTRTERILARTLGEDVSVVTRLTPGLWNTRADPNALEQVLLNLAVNARDAMPRGGTLVIESANVHLDESYALRRGVEVPPGDYVLLAMTDSGEGMAPDIQERIFEPFFTTKGHGRGTGLGLATCHGIVTQAGGYIWVYSELGQGTTFKIYLPRVMAAADTPEPDGARRALEGSETVLVVEDDRQVRELTVRALTRRGYRVLAADSRPLALEEAQRNGVIHLVLTDMVLHDCTGPEVAAQIAALHPEALVLYMSGYTENVIVHRGVLAPGVELLQKPFGPDELVRRVREVLDTARTGPRRSPGG